MSGRQFYFFALLVVVALVEVQLSDVYSRITDLAHVINVQTRMISDLNQMIVELQRK